MIDQKYITENLPVYKQAYDLLKYCITLISNLPKNIRIVYGMDIKNNLYNLINNIYLANSDKDNRLVHINNAITNIRFISLLTRVGFDMNHITEKQRCNVILFTENISKQLHGWKKRSK